MNKILLIPILFFLTLSLKATHNRSGEILYKRIAPFSATIGNVTTPVYTYSITVIKYTDSGPSVADRCMDTVYFGDGTKGLAPRINGLVGSCSCGSVACGEIIISDLGYVLKKNIYTVTHTYSNLGTYTVSSTDPNRNGGIQNIPNSINIQFCIESVIVIDTSLGINSSPVLTNIPADKGFINSCYFHNPGAYDPDGDSLSYQIVACKGASNQPIPNFSFPAFGPGGAFSIDPTKGLLTWCNPQLLGEYNFAILISEWRKLNCNGPYLFMGSVLRDMQAVIGNGTSTSISISNISDTCVVAGNFYSTNFNITTSGQTNLTLIGSSSTSLNLPSATLSPTTGLNNFNCSFNWNTNCDHIRKQPHQVVYYAEQTNILRQKVYKQFNLKIVPPAPLILSVITPTNHVLLTWKKSSNCNDIKGYNIYRKIGVNLWSHGACETGVPAYTGFTLIGFNIPSDTVFDDAYFNPVANGSLGNYIVTTVMNDCSESFADTIKTVAFIVGLSESALFNLDLSAYPNPFFNSLHVQLNGLTFDQIESTLYSVDGKLLKIQLDRNCCENILIKTNDFKPGIYFLHIKTEKGTFVKKVIKE